MLKRNKYKVCLKSSGNDTGDQIKFSYCKTIIIFILIWHSSLKWYQNWKYFYFLCFSALLKCKMAKPSGRNYEQEANIRDFLLGKVITETC